MRLLERPHFTHPPDTIRENLERLSARPQAMDWYVIATLEYDRILRLAVLDIPNHFGESTWGFKAPAVVTYSAGQWAGKRAAMGLCTALLEVGVNVRQAWCRWRGR